MKLKLHHIGIAVKQIDPMIKLFKEKLELEFEEPEYLEAHGVRVTFTEQSPAVEITEATCENSKYYPMLPNPIKKFINEKGEGLHHICFSVKDIDEAFADFQKRAIKIIGGRVQIGSKNKRMFFIDPSETGGILVEIKQE